jgi:hypothetical protein
MLEDGTKLKDGNNNLYQIMGWHKPDNYLYHSQYGGMLYKLKVLSYTDKSLVGQERDMDVRFVHSCLEDGTLKVVEDKK